MLVLWGRGHFEKGPLPHAPPQRPYVCGEPGIARPGHAQKAALSGQVKHLTEGRVLPIAFVLRCLRAWGSGSAGRAPPSQGGGRGFKSLLLHQYFKGLRQMP